MTSNEGLTIGASDLVARLPLDPLATIIYACMGVLLLSSVQRSEVCLDRAILVKLGLDIVIDSNKLLVRH